MRKLVLLFSGLVVVAAIGGASRTVAGPGDGSGAAALSRVSAVGAPVALPAGDRRTTHLLEAGFGDIERIAIHGGRAFYRLNLTSGKACYGAGPAAAEWPLGVIKCTFTEPGFPSPKRPILDGSLVALSQGYAQPHLVRVQGFAADGVAEIAVRDASGATITRLPVINNVYWTENPPANSVSLAALDASGRVLATSP
jgi:hypothetical protein